MADPDEVSTGVEIDEGDPAIVVIDAEPQPEPEAAPSWLALTLAPLIADVTNLKQQMQILTQSTLEIVKVQEREATERTRIAAETERLAITTAAELASPEPAEEAEAEVAEVVEDPVPVVSQNRVRREWL